MLRKFLEGVLALLYMPRVALNFLAPPLRPFERMILQAFVQSSPAPQSKLLEQQISKINYSQLVQFRKSSRLTMWRLGMLSLSMPQTIRLPSKGGEEKYGNAVVEVASKSGNRERVSAELWLLDGQISSLRCHFMLRNYRRQEPLAIEITLKQ